MTSCADGGQTDLLPALVMDTANIEHYRRFDAWMDTNLHVCDFFFAPDSLKDFYALKRNWRLGSMIAGQGICPAYGFSRPAGKGWRSNTEFVRVRIYLNHGGQGVYGGMTSKFGCGDIHIFDYRQEYAGCYADGERLTVFIPYDKINYNPSVDPGQLLLKANSPVGKVLGSFIQELFQCLDGLSVEQGAVFEDCLAQMVEGVIKSNPLNALTSDSFSAARYLAMMQLIDENLANPDLGPEVLCTSFGASRATIYRDFAKVGGVSNFIKSRRLAQAFAQLAAGSAKSGFIGDVAEQWGFGSTCHFSRSFKDTFGISPQEVCDCVHEKAHGTALQALPTPIQDQRGTEWSNWFN